MKYVADTNLLSELLKPDLNAGVVRWVDAASDDLVVSVVTVGELRLGVASLPEGKRRQKLGVLVEELNVSHFPDVVTHNPWSETGAPTQ